jgi:hypothetical protein
MGTEDLIREILSKICPFHGKHPTVEIHEAGKMNILACCEEFHEFIQNIINDKFHNKADRLFDEASSVNI